MFTTKILDLSTLRGKEKVSFKHLVEEKHRGYLSGHDPLHIDGSELICIGASEDGKAVGLLIGSFHPGSVPSELYVVTADAEHQGCGIETALVKEFAELLQKKQSKKIKVLYQIEVDTTPAFEKILSESQWEKGTLAIVCCHFNAQTFSPPWLANKYLLPENCEQFMWKDLTSQEREDLEYLIKQRAIPGHVSPFIKEHLIQWNSSIGLRNKDGVIGWMITHCPGRDLIEFRSIFVFSEYASKGHAMRLLSESIHRMQQNNPPRHATMDTHVGLSDSRWIRFVKHRLLPYAEKVERFAHAWKSFD